MLTMKDLLERSSMNHKHLCPRQVLGVRMGLLGGVLLDIEIPQISKRLLTIVETDGCGADGISVATNCWVGRRTLRVEDYGKMAATFIDTKNKKSIRISPRIEARQLAKQYAPEANSRWEAMLIGYQRMPNHELLSAQEVCLKISIDSIIGRPGVYTQCHTCGEEIINQREEIIDGKTFCRACVGESYYSLNETVEGKFQAFDISI